MSLTGRLERWGTKHLTGIIAVGMGLSIVIMCVLPAIVSSVVGCSIGAFLFFACCFYIYVRATVR